jgi:hypothetical protein
LRGRPTLRCWVAVVSGGEEELEDQSAQLVLGS